MILTFLTIVIDDFNKSNGQYSKKLSSDTEKLPKEFNKLQINSNTVARCFASGCIN
ncbi:hypothetical protein RhiirA4_493041 [Rhizophagus irregularis]|uniref:Uncharacterized protein n=1 Tax=Rhizophagus irregularis TaxID=588596 RepID=A0A2I1HXG0_9GLOM|nr:hypothetical protein RhiirA4_493041 [Rhizophagus irregularis]